MLYFYFSTRLFSIKSLAKLVLNLIELLNSEKCSIQNFAFLSCKCVFFQYILS